MTPWRGCAALRRGDDCGWRDVFGSVRRYLSRGEGQGEREGESTPGPARSTYHHRIKKTKQTVGKRFVSRITLRPAPALKFRVFHHFTWYFGFVCCAVTLCVPPRPRRKALATDSEERSHMPPI